MLIKDLKAKKQLNNNLLNIIIALNFKYCTVTKIGRSLLAYLTIFV